MKAITIKQPWAWLEIDVIKDIENRTWPTKFRGRVLIHAGAAFDFNGWKTIVDNWKSLGLDKIPVDYDFVCRNRDGRFIYKNNIYPQGKIIGSVEIVDCVINHPSIWAEMCPGYHNGYYVGSTEKPIYNWVLANPIKYKNPIPCKGKLRFWEYTGDLPEEKKFPTLKKLPTLGMFGNGLRFI